MRWTERPKEEIFVGLIVMATLGIIAVGVLVALAMIFHL
jgi:hypothetical protein